MIAKAALIILDGWGIGKVKSADAIAQANTPFWDDLCVKYPMSTLVTHGESVGLPEGQMGNSEVGHLNLGAGRIVYQDFAWVSKSMSDNSILQLPNLKALTEIAKSRPLHLIGLVSDGGVHSHIDHLIYLIDYFTNQGIKNIYLHLITDGRDTDPKSGLDFVKKIEQKIEHTQVKIASLIGRYYAMDRDKRWERVASAYQLYCHGIGKRFDSASNAVIDSYHQNITDEFILAAKIGDPNSGLISNGDAVFCFNFRTDRLRELTQVLSQTAFPEYNMKPLDLYYTTMTKYDDSFRNVHVLFEKNDIKSSLGEVISRYGGTQLRIAETEKYPHVSFFFSGGREKVFSGEERILVNSPKVATYDLQPEMSAKEITLKLLERLAIIRDDFICLNFANTDMVGHTGVFSAVKIAAETVDNCLAQLIPTLLKYDYQIIILADHGNGDYMINEDGSPNTAHTKNPVPCILVSKTSSYKLLDGKLADIAPSILYLMGLPIPAEMNGKLLISQKS